MRKKSIFLVDLKLPKAGLGNMLFVWAGECCTVLGLTHCTNLLSCALT
jgi:hypothetical protein